MSDLISRSSIYNYIKAQINPYGKPFKGTAYEFGLKVMDYIENTTPVEAVPVVHGEWIPCSERLPEDEEKVLVCTSFEYKRNDEIKRVHNITCAMYESGNLMCEDSDYSWDYDCRGEYDEDKDDYHTLEGWFEITVMEHEEWTAVGIDRKVIAWMPLPAPYDMRKKVE